MVNKRRTPRSAFLALAKVFDMETRSNIGYVGDVSTGGIMLFANRAFKREERRLLSINLPHPRKGEVTIQLGVRIAWQMIKTEQSGQPLIGCQILALGPKDRVVLLQAAKAYGLAA